MAYNSSFPSLQSAIKVDKGVVGKAGVAQEKDAVPGEEESEAPVSDSSSSSSSSSSSEPMEASDEGRKAEDIPAKEIEDSLHKAEVRPSGTCHSSLSRLTRALR